MYARRLQIQERLTEEIAFAVKDSIGADGVGVMIEARHLCMMMRGVQKQNSRTITSALRGIRSEPTPEPAMNSSPSPGVAPGPRCPSSRLRGQQARP